MKIIKRRFFDDISRFSEEQVMPVLHGARQTGKSTALAWWLEAEAQKGRTTMYLDLEDPVILDVCNMGVTEFLRYLRSRNIPLNSTSLALDEIQYIADPSRFLKLLFDGYGKGFHIAVSGSSSFAIKSKFKESLAGRTLPIEVFGLDFEEYCRFIGEERDFSMSWPPSLESATSSVFREFSETGAYPGLATTADRDIKGRRIRQIIQAYIQSDIRELGKVRYPDRFGNFLRILGAQAGSLVNVLELAESLRMGRSTVEEYLFLLEQTYVIRRLRPFSSNMRSELTKMPKLYFEDTGVLAMERGREFTSLDGPLFENTVFCELRKRIGAERLRFWRTTRGNEVDFVLDEGAVAIEVKLKPRGSDCASLVKFGEHYGCKRLVICGMEPPRTLPQKVEFIYPWHIASAFA